MAVLATTTATPADSASLARGVHRVFITNGEAGVTITPIAAAVTGSYHTIVGGLISVSKACGIDICSGTTVRASIEFAVSATAHFPVGFETTVSEQLAITNAGAAACVGYIDYITHQSGVFIGI